MRPGLFATMLVLWATLANPADAQNRALAPLFPPLVESADGVTATGGLSVELVREAAKRSSIPIAIEVQPWARALFTASTTLDVLLFPVARTSDREDLFEWLGPVNRLDYQVYRLRSGAAPRVTALDQLTPRSVGVLRNDVIHLFLANTKITLQTAAQVDTLVALLMGGRVDYIVTTPLTLRTELAKLRRSWDEVESQFSVDGFSPDPYSYLVVLKGSQPGLVAALRKGLDSMRRDGSWEAIFRKYQ